MNKLAEKVAPIMNDAELNTLILSHYEGEAQTLTTGAEANLFRGTDGHPRGAGEGHEWGRERLRRESMALQVCISNGLDLLNKWMKTYE